MQLAGFDRLSANSSNEHAPVSNRVSPSASSSHASGSSSMVEGDVINGYQCITIMNRGAAGYSFLVRNLEQGLLCVLKVRVPENLTLETRIVFASTSLVHRCVVHKPGASMCRTQAWCIDVYAWRRP